jgi:hypothetical protein
MTDPDMTDHESCSDPDMTNPDVTDHESCSDRT